MEHRKLDALMSPMERIARVAVAGVSASRAQQTSPSGAISLDNADGTRTIIGEVVNGESNPSYTMATHVGDTTPPGIPTGITATSKSGVVVVEWDGTLSGGIPDDFYCVRVYLDGAELGALSEAGSVASAKLQSGTTHSITATSEDDCCLPDGTPAHNVSDATQAISVTIAKDASEVMADIDEQIEGVEQEIADFKSNTYTKEQVNKKVDEGPDSLKSWITANYTNSQDLGTTYATKTLVSQTKEEIELSTSQTYATKEDLSKTYATKAALTVGLDGVRSEVSETYSTKQATADAIAAIQVGGRNLITLEETYLGGVNQSTGADTAVNATVMNRRSGYIPVTGGEPYCAQSWLAAQGNQNVFIFWYRSDKSYIGYKAMPNVDTHATLVEVAPNDAAFARIAWRTFGNGWAKFEQGTLPTDYTPAPEDLTARPNLTPYGTHDFADVYDATDNPDGYWMTTPQSQYFTQLDDGWIHVHIDNSAGTGTPVPNTLRPRQVDGLEGGELVTLLLEVRNNHSSTTGTATTSRFYVQATSGAQLYGNAPQTANLTNDSNAYPLREGETFSKRMVYVVDTTHLPASGKYGEAFRLGFRTEAGVNLDFELRASLYRGGYEGGYVPYSVEDTTLSKTYTKSSTFVQTVDGLDGRITATEDGLAVQETLIRQYANGVLVCKVGESVGALVNASGSFDVVSVSWSGNNPTVTGTLSTFMQNLIELGKGNTSAEIQFCDNTGNISVKPNYKGNQAIAMGADNTTIQADEDVYVAAGTEWGQYVLVSELSKMVELHAATSPTAMGTVRVSSSGIGIDYQSGLATGAGISMLDITPSSGDPYPHMEIMSSGDIDFNAGKGVRILGPNLEGTPMRGIFFGSKIINPNGAAYGTLFTQAECVSNFGRKLNNNKDMVLVMNGDSGVYGGQMTASLNGSSEVRVYMSPTRSGNTRINYLVILGA